MLNKLMEAQRKHNEKYADERAKAKAEFKKQMDYLKSDEYKKDQEKWKSKGKKIRKVGLVMTLGITLPVILTMFLGFLGTITGLFIGIIMIGAVLKK